MPVIKLTQIQKHVLTRSILQPIDLTIPTQQITAITGDNEAAKATLLHIIAGYQQPDQGKITFDHQLVFNAAQHLNLQPTARKVTLLGHDFAFWPQLTVRENLAFPLRNHLTPTALTARVARYLALLDLTELQHRYPGDLSQLQKQQLALARLLAQQPAVLIFDEVWSLGNDTLALQLRTLVATLARRLALTTVMVLTDDHAATHLADYVAHLQHGQLDQMGTAKKLVLPSIS